MSTLEETLTLKKNTRKLEEAAWNGHLDVVKKLIRVSDPKADDSQALWGAAGQGHLEVVRELIPVSDPKAKDSWALQEAAWRGHLSVVRELLPVSDYAAARASLLSIEGNEKVVRLLDSVALEKTLQREVTTPTMQPNPTRRPRL